MAHHLDQARALAERAQLGRCQRGGAAVGRLQAEYDVGEAVVARLGQHHQPARRHPGTDRGQHVGRIAAPRQGTIDQHQVVEFVGLGLQREALAGQLHDRRDRRHRIGIERRQLLRGADDGALATIGRQAHRQRPQHVAAGGFDLQQAQPARRGPAVDGRRRAAGHHRMQVLPARRGVEELLDQALASRRQHTGGLDLALEHARQGRAAMREQGQLGDVMRRFGQQAAPELVERRQRRAGLVVAHQAIAVAMRQAVLDDHFGQARNQRRLRMGRQRRRGERVDRLQRAQRVEAGQHVEQRQHFGQVLAAARAVLVRRGPRHRLTQQFRRRGQRRGAGLARQRPVFERIDEARGRMMAAEQVDTAETAGRQARGDAAVRIEEIERGHHRMRAAALDAHQHALDRVAAQVVDAADLHRHVGGAIAVAGHAAEQHEKRMEAAVHQRRMQAPGRQRGRVAGLGGRGQLGQRGLAGHPHLAHPAEGRAVFEADRRRALVERRAVKRRLRAQRMQRRARHHRVGVERGAARQQAARHVQRPGHVAHPVARLDLEHRGLGIDAQAEQLGLLRLEHHRRADLEILERRLVGFEVDARGGQRHLDVTSAGEGDAAVHHVVGEQRQLGRVELVLPAEGVLVQPVAEQRMLAAAIDEVVALDARRQPMMLVLPWIGRQRHGRGRGHEAVEIDVRAMRDGRQDRAVERGRAALLALERGQHRALRLRGGQPVLHVAAQDRMRRHLDEDPRAVGDQARDAVAETHRLADVAPPVARVERGAVEPGARHGRHEAAVAGRRREPGQLRQYQRLDAVHLAAVEGIVEIEQLVEAPAVALGRLDRLQALQGTRQRDRLGAVDAGHLDQAGEA